jgi:hypothetical protein
MTLNGIYFHSKNVDPHKTGNGSVKIQTMNNKLRSPGVLKRILLHAVTRRIFFHVDRQAEMSKKIGNLLNTVYRDIPLVQTLLLEMLLAEGPHPLEYL